MLRAALELLAKLALAECPLAEPQERHGRLFDGLDGRCKGARVSSKWAAALAAAERAGADHERAGTRGVVDEPSIFYGTDNEIAGTTGNSPRSG